MAGPPRAAAADGQLLWWWGVAAGLLILVAYFGNERSFLHRSVVERIFWPCVYGWFALLYLTRPMPDAKGAGACADDGRLTPTAAAAVVLAALLGCAVYTHNRRQRMTSRVTCAAMQQLARTLALRRHIETVPALVATARLAEVLGAQGSPPGLVRGLLWELRVVVTGSRLRAQGKILAALQDCLQASPADLLYVFSSGNIDLPELFALAGTRDVMALIHKLTPHMDVVIKARIIDALHRQVDFVHLFHLQLPVVDMICQTQGNELTTLKNLIDETGDFYNLHKLVFCDLAPTLSEKVLHHIENEAGVVQGNQARKLDANGSRCEKTLPRKILSDIDDTLYSSGGRFPAGIDRRFPRKQLYPGVLALFRELDNQQELESAAASAAHATEEGAVDASGVQLRLRLSSFHDWVDVEVPTSETVDGLRSRLMDVCRGRTPSWPSSLDSCTTSSKFEVCVAPQPGQARSNLAFLSARPHAYKDYMESRSYRFLWSLHTHGGLHCMPTLLFGNLGASTRSALLGALLKFWPHVGLFLASLCILAFSLHRHFVLCCLVLVAFLCTSATARRWRKVVWAPVGLSKAQMFRQYQRLHPEFSFVFLGDNGQGDLLCAETLAAASAAAAGAAAAPWWRPAAAPGRGTASGAAGFRAPAASFVHEVMPREQQLTSLSEGLSPSECEEAWSKLNVYFHRTYVGAAINAWSCGLISLAGLARVGRAAVEDLIRMRIGQLRDVRRGWPGHIAELNADVERANRLLPAELQIEPVPEAAGAQGALLGLHLASPASAATTDAANGEASAGDDAAAVAAGAEAAAAAAMGAEAAAASPAGLERFVFRTAPSRR